MSIEIANFKLIGISHKSAPIEVREKFAIPEARLPSALQSLVQHPGVSEGLILSTCNRVEFLVHSTNGDAELLSLVHDHGSIPPGSIKQYFYEYRAGDAVRHLFRVAAGLDSMILGEAQILGQLKQARAVARAAGSIGRNLNRLLDRAFMIAKRVRSETAVGCSAVSIASVAVELAQKIFGQLGGKKVLLVGSGKMAELVCRHLLARGACSIIVANRTFETAQDMADRFGGNAIPLDRIHQACEHVDIVITATGSASNIFRAEHGEELIKRRKGRPIFFIDIAVPRDVDPELGHFPSVFVYDVDDLRQTAMPHIAQREHEAELAEEIIDVEIERILAANGVFDVVPTIVSLQNHIESIRQGEINRLRGRLGQLTPEQTLAIDWLTRAIVKKIAHSPITTLKQLASSNDAPAAVEIVQRLFQLQNDDAA